MDAPSISRFNVKMRKYDQLAILNGCKFVPTVLSHIGQMGYGIMVLICHQIDYKLQLQNQLRQHDSTSSIVKVKIRKLLVVINRTASRHALDRSLKMVDLLNFTQRDGDLLPDDNTFP